MAYSRLFTPRNLALFSLLSLGGGYGIVKTRTLAEKRRERASGDYSVSVDRSGRRDEADCFAHRRRHLSLNNLMLTASSHGQRRRNTALVMEANGRRYCYFVGANVIRLQIKNLICNTTVRPTLVCKLPGVRCTDSRLLTSCR
ncbi:hypothetical protein CC80DRAFT_223631 [Byssothecium circinans]|uniref:Uncharacterized protein n=1 Tax=Byssothecium circinans TaxID=147558 RepID=A0A6A5TIX3_9PLEO|nr:hypothetical protein CC80DRAFT_294968 [Byssothecium circinans]KAF1950854.1 hypothetical protein CC80DRAFT_223631 [Byssothecium circinans]